MFAKWLNLFQYLIFFCWGWWRCRNNIQLQKCTLSIGMAQTGQGPPAVDKPGERLHREAACGRRVSGE